jgi:hypothetical protein
MAEATEPPEVDPLAEAVLAHIRTLITIKARLPFLLALSEELGRIGVGKPVRNDILLQVAHDSFDLLVIDLASLREGMTNGDGSALHLLTKHTAKLRRFRLEDCNPRIQAVDESSPAIVKSLNDHVRQTMADGMNKSFDRLFPEGEPVTGPHVKALMARFRKDTEATDRDRNRVRAHLYERAFEASYRQDLLPKRSNKSECSRRTSATCTWS